MEADIQSPIDLTSRTPTHIRFAESEISQLVEHQPANRGARNFENQSSQRSALSDMAAEISRLRSEISEIRRISPALTLTLNVKFSTTKVVERSI